MSNPEREAASSETTHPLRAVPSRRQVLAVGGAGLGALLLAACGGGSTAGSTSGSQATGAPKKGGTIQASISDGDSSESLDPGLILSSNSMTYCGAIYEPLFSVNTDFKPTPLLAESWESNADATQWTFHLRKGVKGHDGSDVTSKDVVATMRRWIDKSAGSAMYGSMSPYLTPSGISAPDASTVVVKLSKPNSALLAFMGCNFSNKIIKAGTTKFTTATAIGTGPFKLTSWTPGVRWTAARNDAYWGTAAYLDGINITVTPDQGAKLQAALSGAADVTDTIPISLWSTLEGRGNVTLKTMVNRNAWVFSFDQRKAPFNDPRVLQALKLATDREAIVKTALQGHGSVSSDIGTIPDSAYYPKNFTAEHNVTKAKSLLAEAGYANGLTIEINTTGAVPGMLDVAQAWQQVVKPAGINVTLKQWPLTTYWSQAWMATPAFQDYWNLFHPAQILNQFYQPSSTWDEARHDDPALDAMVGKILSTTDTAQQEQLIQEAFVHATRTFSYVIPVWANAGWAQSTKVNGFHYDFVNSLDFSKTWLS
jgi:peptide/nickel transport system substrate-binding protein